MNQLSWLLYLANVLSNLGPALVILGLVVAALAGVAWSVGTSYGYSTNPGDVIVRKKIIPWAITGTVVTLMMWTGAIFCPSSDTVYAIEASQIGEQALKTPLAIKAEKAVEAWLDKQIAKKD